MQHPKDAYWSELVESYKKTHRQLQRAYQKESQKEVVDIGVRASISESLSSIRFAIDWMEQGWEPDCQRDIDRRSREQREVLVDPIVMQSLYEGYVSLENEEHVPIDQVEYLEEVLSILSRRERECFVMHYAGCLSHKKIAETLGISTGNVYTFLMRARKKIREYRDDHRFDLYADSW